MAIGSGLGASSGYAQEATPGTYQAPTRWDEVNKFDMKRRKVPVQGGGIAAGRMAQVAQRRVIVSEDGTGSREQEVTKKGMGLLLDQIFAGGGTPTQQLATTAYLQARTLADNFGKSMTFQNGVPDTGGTVRPRTGVGGKCTKASFSCTRTGLLMLTTEWDFAKVSKVQTLVAPSFAATPPAAFHGGEMRVGLGTFGSEAAIGGVRGYTLDIERPMATDRYNASTVNPAVKDQAIMNDFVKVSGSLEVEFQNETDLEDRFLSDVATSLSLEHIGAIIASTYAETFRLRVPAVFFEDTIAVVDGPGIRVGTIPFTGQLDLVNGLVTCDYMSTDTTV